MNGIFITGTDTGVGKTLAAACILRLLRSGGIDAVPMKPVETGVSPETRGSDIEFSLDAIDFHPTLEEFLLMRPYAYEELCSPELAGGLAGFYPETAVIKECARELASRHDGIVVEGAGGVMVPLNREENMLDLMRELSLPVVLVARAALGTINHTLLSLEALRSAGLTVLGVILNSAVPGEDDFVARRYLRQAPGQKRSIRMRHSAQDRMLKNTGLCLNRIENFRVRMPEIRPPP